MIELFEQRQERWQQLVIQAAKEFLSLSQAEKDRIADLLAQIDRLQHAIHQLFEKAGGERICAVCEGACCARGHNHVSLANLSAYLLENELPPPADFTQTCPWLTPQGCAHEVGRRPYNCITFLCDKLEGRLDDSDIEEFYQLDRDLRNLYQAFADRYVSGGMSGLLIQSARLNGRPLFSLRSESDD